MMRVEEKAAPAKAAREVNQQSLYQKPQVVPRRILLTQAGDVLALLSLFHLTTAERTAFTLLLAHRLRRAYTA